MAVWPLGGPFFGLRAGFWPFLAIPQLVREVPLILVRDQRNLLGPSGSPKKWPTLTTDPVPAGITEKRPLLRFAEKWKTGRKSVFRQKTTPKRTKDCYSFGERVLFHLHNFARSWGVKKKHPVYKKFEVWTSLLAHPSHTLCEMKLEQQRRPLRQSAKPNPADTLAGGCSAATAPRTSPSSMIPFWQPIQPNMKHWQTISSTTWCCRFDQVDRVWKRLGYPAW